jgi:lipopolysaccharide transport system ATP-binding protein
MNNTLISLNHAGICYGRRRGVFGTRFWALKDVTFNLYTGETLGIIGRNGAGKSTLLRLLAGIIKPNRGSIDITPGCRASLLSLQLGFVPNLSGRENAILSGMLMGLRRREIEAKLPAILEFSELGDFFERSINTYSSGMKARLGFSVAFQVDPDILLVDEVLGVGDAEFNQKSTLAMQEKIKANKTVVFVSHNPQMVQLLCDRVVWIENGKTRLEGKTEDVLNRYIQDITS